MEQPSDHLGHRPDLRGKPRSKQRLTLSPGWPYRHQNPHPKMCPSCRRGHMPGQSSLWAFQLPTSAKRTHRQTRLLHIRQTPPGSTCGTRRKWRVLKGHPLLPAGVAALRPSHWQTPCIAASNPRLYGPRPSARLRRGIVFWGQRPPPPGGTDARFRRRTHTGWAAQHRRFAARSTGPGQANGARGKSGPAAP